MKHLPTFESFNPNEGKSSKLEKIERRAWEQYNWHGRSFSSKVMMDLRKRWEDEVEKICGSREEMKMKSTHGGYYTYNFGDIVA